VHRALENNGGHKAAGAGGMRLVPAAGVIATGGEKHEQGKEESSFHDESREGFTGTSRRIHGGNRGSAKRQLGTH
jgi:hypothetical protein